MYRISLHGFTLKFQLPTNIKTKYLNNIPGRKIIKYFSREEDVTVTIKNFMTVFFFFIYYDKKNGKRMCS